LRALEAGFDAYISKPFRAKELIELVNSFARRDGGSGGDGDGGEFVVGGAGDAGLFGGRPPGGVGELLAEGGGVLDSAPADLPGGRRAFRVRDPDGFRFAISS
jgi:hypothetical protein